MQRQDYFYHEPSARDGVMRALAEPLVRRPDPKGRRVDVVLFAEARPVSLAYRVYLSSGGVEQQLPDTWIAPYATNSAYCASAEIDRRSVDSLADDIVRDATVGVGGTGIRAGIIGEIGTDKPWLSAQEERVHRAAARAARWTGLAITTHAVQSTVGLDQLDVFEAEGADLTRVAIGHADSNPSLDYHLAIVERGATVEFDFLGMTFTPLERHGEGRIIDNLRALIGRGHVERILLSQDVCHDSQLRRYGGNGYTYLAESFLPRLREAGVSEAEIRTIKVDNPRRLLTIV